MRNLWSPPLISERFVLAEVPGIDLSLMAHIWSLDGEDSCDWVSVVETRQLTRQTLNRHLNEAFQQLKASSPQRNSQIREISFVCGKGHSSRIGGPTKAVRDIPDNRPLGKSPGLVPSVPSREIQTVPFDWISSLQFRLRGTEFQLRVWRGLLRLKMPCSYSDLCKRVGLEERFSRAVAQAVGKNSVSFFVPCHLVLPKSSVDQFLGGRDFDVGGYRWGAAAKLQLLKSRAPGFHFT